MNNNPLIEFKGDFKFDNTARNILTAFTSSIDSKHKLSQNVINMKGMSGTKYRYWINNFVSLQKNSRYLEIGSWRGSTACSAMLGNKLSLTCIDNWSEFLAPKKNFLKNIKMCENSESEFKFIESDFRSVDYQSIGKFDIYLFDGPHLEKDQYDGIQLALPALDETFTLIVDDWNWEQVRDGTNRALNDLGINTHCSITITTNANPHWMEATDWHNGYFIALCSK